MKIQTFLFISLLVAPLAATAQLSTVFSDNFTGGSNVKSTTPAPPTINSTSYEEISSIGWSPSPPVIANGGLTFGIKSTGGNEGEIQALFTTSPVKLTNAGDYVQITATFTNIAGLLTQDTQFGIGLYNSIGSAPFGGGLNSGVNTNTAANTNAATGGAQNWTGYLTEFAFPGGSESSEIVSRSPQTATNNNNQITVVPGSFSKTYGYNTPNGSIVGSASATPDITLVVGGTYTEVVNFTLQASGAIQITGNLYTNNTSGTLLTTQTGTTGATPVTNSFDAFSMGFRSTGNSSATTIDISSIQVAHFVACTPAISSISPSSLTNGVIGLNYSETISPTGGTGPYTYAVATGLPPGLNIDSSSGVISGIPTTLGTYNFTVTVTDSAANDCVASKNLSIIVNSCITAISGITPTILTNGIFGSNYSQTISASGGTTPYIFSVSSGLPPGLSIDSSSGIISGEPTAPGIYNFTVTVNDSATNDCPVSQNLSMVVVLAQRSETFDTAASSASDGWFGVSNQTGNATTAPFFGWANTNLAGPAGEAGGFIGRINAANFYGDIFTTAGTFSLTNTLTMSGNFTIAVLSTNEDTRFGYFQYDTVAGTVLNTNNNVLGFYFNEPKTSNPNSFKGMRIGIVYPFNNEQIAGFYVYPNTNYSWSWTYSPPPAGTNNDGVITFTLLGGATNSSGLFTTSNQLVLNLTNNLGTNTYNAFGIANEGGLGSLSAEKTTIYYDNLSYTANCGPIPLSPASLTNGLYGSAYSQTISASGGVSPYTYSVASGLPAGLSIDSSSGEISGTPTAAGTFNFTVIATDSSSNNCVGGENLSIVVSPLPVEVTGTRTYNGTNTAPAAILFVANPVGTDVVTVVSGNGTLADSAAGLESISSFSGLVLGGASAANYTFTGASGSVTVSPKALTVSGLTADSTTYDATTTAKLGGTASFQAAESPGSGNASDGTPYNVDPVSVGGTIVGTLAAKDVGTEAVTITGITVTGTGLDNYTVTQPTGLTQNVTTKTLSVSGITAGPATYDGTITAKLGGTAAFQAAEPSGAGSTSDGAPYIGDSISAAGVVAGTLAAKDVGVEAVTVSGVTVTGPDSGDYAVMQPTGLTQNVTPKALTVSGNTAGDTTYDGTTTAKLGGTAAFPAAEAPGAGSTSDGAPYTVDSISVGGTAAGTLAAKDVGVEAVTVTGVTVTGSVNYSVTQQTGLTQNVTPKSLTVSGITAGTTVYDGTTAAKLGGTAALQATEPAGASTTSDGMPYNVDAVSAAGTAVGTLAAKDVGAEPVTITGVTLTGTGFGNYSVAQQTGLTQNVTAKALTALGTLSISSKVYDGTTNATPLGTAALQTAEATGTGNTSDNTPYTGNGDAVSLTGTPSYGYNSADVVSATVVTESGLSLTGSGNGDYTLTAPSLSASITPASTTNTITSSANPALPGSNVTFTATLSAVAPGAGTPTGEVIFLDGTNDLATNALDISAVASFTTNSLSHTNHTITAQYAGDGNFLGSTNTLNPDEVINTPPIAGQATYSRQANLPLTIAVSDLLTNATDADGDVISLISVSSPSTNGATVVLNTNNFITYTQAATNGNLPDAFTYTVADTFGATSTGTVDVTILASSQPINITGITRLPDGTLQLNFSGIPDYTYLIEATTDLMPPAVWTTLSTNMSDTNGLFQYIDAAATNFTTRYYRTAQP